MAAPRYYCLQGLFLTLLWRLCDAKNPVIKWGQRPDKLYLTALVPEIEDPVIKIKSKSVIIKGASRGQEYDVALKLLRPINTTASSYEVNRWNVVFTLKKMREEPCWKRLLKSKETFSWLKKDLDKTYGEECQRRKEMWRDTYFSAKLAGRDPNTDPDEDPDNPDSKKDKPIEEPPDKKEARLRWEKQLEQFRKRAVPRSSQKKLKSKRKGANKKSEL